VSGAASDAGVAERVAGRWWRSEVVLSRLTVGLINQTFAVHQGGAPIAVLQQLHPIFAAEVNLDIEVVTAHLDARGLVTPRLLRTAAGEAWTVEDGKVWRALSWVDGRCVATAPDARWAEAGGELVGRFHRAVADLRHDYHFSRGNVHDTPRYFARLEALLSGDRTGVDPQAPRAAEIAEASQLERELAEAAELGHRIRAAFAQLPALAPTAQRHCHGDLKLSNLLFSPEDPVTGRCLVDLDTLCRGTIAFELGDAMRSWCNPAGEDRGAAAFDLGLFAAAMRGFRGVADPLLSDAERDSIVVGLATVCVELAARFCIDAFEDRYFGWNAASYPSRRRHNLVRAESQLALARSVLAQLDDALAIVRGAAGG
jgi:Ser/Thr protein kinase RdoA (MazF antagonist)